uniref:Uncharacterized protein n=1 Tax=Arundo donax TaxID=35708 RepID=A0A0A9H9C3_ARUDO
MGIGCQTGLGNGTVNLVKSSGKQQKEMNPSLLTSAKSSFSSICRLLLTS